MVKIIADTLSCIPPEEARQLGLAYIPQIIIFGEESFRDDTEMDSIAFLKRLPSSPTLPKTAAPPPAFYDPFYKQYSEEGHTIIVICPSAEMSGTVRSATVAAEDFPNADIRIIDTKILAAGLGNIVYKALEWANQGLDADTIEKRINEMATRNRVYFVVDTLEYLLKGGRIGPAKALMGSILQVKPILMLRNGHTEPFESQRTKRRAHARMQEVIMQECPRGEDAHFAIMHADNEADALTMKAFFEKEMGFNNIPIYLLPPAVIVHSGPGAMGFSFFTAPK